MKAKELKVGIVLGLILLLGLSDFSEATTIEDDWWNESSVFSNSYSSFMHSSINIDTTIEISVATEKSTYLLGEDFWVFVTAYNPNPEPVTLTIAHVNVPASYLLDDVFNWSDGLVRIPTVVYQTIDPLDSYTWELHHSNSRYFLNPGTHTIEGEVVGYGFSSPINIEVVPEPISVLFLVSGMIYIRSKKRRMFH